MSPDPPENPPAPPFPSREAFKAPGDQVFGPPAGASADAAEFRLPADRRLAARPGLPRGPLPGTLLRFVDAFSRGDVAALLPLLDDAAQDTLRRMAEPRGIPALSEALRRRGLAICDCRLERMLSLPDGTVECRLRLFRLRPGGQIRSYLWVAQARHSPELGWQITSFQILPRETASGDLGGDFGGEPGSLDSPGRVQP